MIDKKYFYKTFKDVLNEFDGCPAIATFSCLFGNYPDLTTDIDIKNKIMVFYTNDKKKKLYEYDFSDCENKYLTDLDDFIINEIQPEASQYEEDLFTKENCKFGDFVKSYNGVQNPFLMAILSSIDLRVDDIHGKCMELYDYDFDSLELKNINIKNIENDKYEGCVRVYLDCDFEKMEQKKNKNIKKR